MAEEQCRDMLFIWSVGYNGRCLNEEFGFRFGKTGFKKVLFQVSAELININILLIRQYFALDVLLYNFFSF